MNKLPPLGVLGQNIPKSPKIYILSDNMASEAYASISLCPPLDDNENEEPVIISTGALSGVVVRGELDKWGRPVCNMIVGTGKCYSYISAVINTGAYYTHIDISVAERLKAVAKNYTSYNNPTHGKVELPNYLLTYGFSGIDNINFVSEVKGMNFDVDMLIGMQFILEFCDLHIYGPEKRFELVFK